MGWLGDGSIEGRVARPERRWGCRRGTPVLVHKLGIYIAWFEATKFGKIRINGFAQGKGEIRQGIDEFQ